MTSHISTTNIENTCDNFEVEFEFDFDLCHWKYRYRG